MTLYYFTGCVIFAIIFLIGLKWGGDAPKREAKRKYIEELTRQQEILEINEKYEQERIIEEGYAKESQSNCNKWLSSQASAPKYAVLVVTKSGLTYGSGTLEPTALPARQYSSLIFDSYPYVPYWHTVTATSQQRANCIVYKVRNEGWYHHPDSNTHIPLHEIESIQVLEVK